MNSLTILLLCLVVVVICVIVVSYAQKREQEKAEQRQKINQYRYRANQALSVYDNLGTLPIGPECRQLLLEYTRANWQAIAKLSPSDNIVSQQVSQIESQLKSTQSPADSQRLTIPDDAQELAKLINSLSKLASFILKLRKTDAVSKSLVPVATNRVMALISEAKICAYIQQGKRALGAHEYVKAQRNFLMAQQMILKVSSKNPRLEQLQTELESLIKSSPTEADQTTLDFNPEPELQPPSQLEESLLQEEGSDLFGPKKKW